MIAFRRYFRNISDRDVLFLLFGFFLAAIIFSFASHLGTAQPDLLLWLDGFFQNFGTEMFGAFLTFLLIEVLVDTRRNKERLIRQLGSRANSIALNAVEELSVRGWLSDGSLEGRRFVQANLQGADLLGAELEGVNLGGANMEGVNLNVASLAGATLAAANLKGAILADTVLGDADLREADLTEAHVLAYFNEGTLLPDGTHWKPGTDMDRFTDPKHPEFWRSDHLSSPAYRGDDPANSDES